MARGWEEISKGSSMLVAFVFIIGGVTGTVTVTVTYDALVGSEPARHISGLCPVHEYRWVSGR
jgi:hypothetical protein